MATARIELPPKLVPVFTPPRGSVRYRGAYGGRGSGKSYSFAKMAAIWGYAERLKILCTREFQNSIKDSVHAQLAAAIESEPFLAAHYDIGESYIKGANGTEFIFKGLRRNIGSIQSMADIDLCMVEEAEYVPENSWRKLIPTIRKERSEIWPVWNPEENGSPVDQRFRQVSRDDALIVEVNHADNPWFPQVLEDERLNDQRNLDPNTYAHIWEGAYLENSDRQVFAHKWRVAEFDPGSDWNGPYHGLDFGFSQDPTACTRSWVHDDCLYIEYEAGKVQLEIVDTAQFLKNAIPEIQEYEIQADSARPEMISHLRSNGLPRTVAVKKGPGSVEDGIAHMRGYREIIIHPRCKETRKEFRLYSHKVDPKSGQVLPGIVDAHNHYIDATRYALVPIMKRRAMPRVRSL